MLTGASVLGVGVVDLTTFLTSRGWFSSIVAPEVIRATSKGTIVATTRGSCEIGAAISSAV